MKLPRIGMALWLVRGSTVAEKVRWLACHGFSSVAILPNDNMKLKPEQKRDAAQAMRDSGMMLTYHGNSPYNRLKPGNKLDEDFVGRMIEDVVWWHENTGGVHCCCSDPISGMENGKDTFFQSESLKLALMLGEALTPLGIRVGIENTFGLKGRVCSVADMKAFKQACGDLDIGFLIDAGHTNIHIQSDGDEGENDISRFIAAIPGDILEVHLSDNHGKQDEHEPLGTGNLDLISLVSALRARQFSGPFTVETGLGPVSEPYVCYIEDPEKVSAMLMSRDALLSAWQATSKL